MINYLYLRYGKKLGCKICFNFNFTFCIEHHKIKENLKSLKCAIFHLTKDLELAEKVNELKDGFLILISNELFIFKK